MRHLIASCLAMVIAFPVAAYAQPDLRAQAQDFFEPIPTSLPEVAGNAMTPEKVELGLKLFFEPRLSRSGIISCNTCHSVGTGGADNVPTSIGHGWQKGPRNAPTVLNAVFNTAQFWDGRAEDLRTQAAGPIQASVEMNSTPERVITTLKSIPAYVEEFSRAFPRDKDPVNFNNVTVAIEAFEATLITPNAPFDLWLKGDDNALTDEQKQGLALFMDRGCVACHAGINVGGDGYFPFGVVERPGADILPPDDRGRFTVTETADDEYVFRAPSLRNVALTAPYFHSGGVWDLEQAVAVMASAQLGTELNENEIKQITAFLHSLTGDQPRVVYPVLPPSTRDTPRPE
ncbi:cytochrome-c peroxidase [Telmatospirillum sp. J64-1]|uniref:cytochrome-c peroxidase n=1 Tax=Telmatospirillum sp. J64-1 TaxID=2502183 RepID=UPI00115EAA76|nr:cytochrome-c peroxidase [Telmatospirillum sp. J64-1]